MLICEVASEGSSEYYWLSGNGTIEDEKVLVSTTVDGTKTAATSENSTAVAIANAKSGEEVTDTGEYIKPASEMTEEELVEATAAGASKTFAEIGSKEELIAFRDAWNNGKLAGGTFKLTADIDVSGEDWIPIGNWEFPFNGTFDGNGKTINGLTKTRLANEDIYSEGTTTKYMGVVFGFFGIVGGGDVNISKLTMANVNIDLPSGIQVASIIGYAPNHGDFTSGSKGGAYWADTETQGKKVLPENYGSDDINLEYVSASGSISAKQHTGGLVGKAYNTGEFKASNCTNNCNITVSISSCAGICGYINGQSSAVFDNCSNNGNIAAGSALSGIVTSSNGFVLTVKNSNNAGTIEWKGSSYTTKGWNNGASSSADNWGFIANGTETGAKTLINNTNTGKFVYGDKEIVGPSNGMYSYSFTDSNGHVLTLDLRDHFFDLKIDDNTTFHGRWAIGSTSTNSGSFMMRQYNSWDLLAEVKNVKTADAFVLTDANSTFGNYNLAFNITGDNLETLKSIIALNGDDSNGNWNSSIAQ